MLWQCPEQMGDSIRLVTLVITQGITWCTLQDLHFTLGYELLCRPDVSPGFLCSCPRNLKTKSRKLWWARASNQTANFLTYNCVQELPENELANVSATNECISVEDRVLESNSRAAVRGMIHTILPSLWRTSAYRNRLKTNKWSSRQWRSILL